jgi:SP family sugar:H+ symporter-like MFS transporter
MYFFHRTAEKEATNNTVPVDNLADNTHIMLAADIEPQGRVPVIAVILCAVASIGGFMFG